MFAPAVSNAVSGATYCGSPPIPGSLLARFNLDPVLIAALVAIAGLNLWQARRDGRSLAPVAAGWAVASGAFLSPLCALSVSLFAARIGQHMILMLIAAPLIAAGLPSWRTFEAPRTLWGATVAVFVFLWFWHMPVPYAATFASTAIYWTMHVTLFGSAIVLWAALLRGHGAQTLAAGTVTSMHMGLLGAVICLAGHPMYAPHYFTTEAWGMTPLADQQLGGVLMWVPGCLLFLWAALHSLTSLWSRLESAPA